MEKVQEMKIKLFVENNFTCVLKTKRNEFIFFFALIHFIISIISQKLNFELEVARGRLLFYWNRKLLRKGR